MADEEMKARQLRSMLLGIRARALDTQGLEPDHVESLYNEALSLDPTDIRLRGLLAVYYIDMGLHVEAEQTIRARPLSTYEDQHALAHLLLLPAAQAYYDHRYYKKAAELLRACSPGARHEAAGLIRLVDHALSREVLGALLFPLEFSQDQWWTAVELPMYLHVDGRGVTQTSWAAGYLLAVHEDKGVEVLMATPDSPETLVRSTIPWAYLAPGTSASYGMVVSLGKSIGPGQYVEIARYDGLGILLANRQSYRDLLAPDVRRWRTMDPQRYAQQRYNRQERA